MSVIVHLTKDAGSRRLEVCLGYRIRQCHGRHGEARDESIVRLVRIFVPTLVLLFMVVVALSRHTLRMQTLHDR